MNNIVKRYPLQSVIGLTQSIYMPMRADLIDVKIQRGNFWLYATINSEYEEKQLMEHRNIKIVITDHKSSIDLPRHISTVIHNDSFTEREFHFFEV